MFLDAEIMPCSAKACRRITSPACASGALLGNATSRSASSLSATRRWNGSSPVSRSAACTNACSPCWRWRANRSTRGS